MIFLRVRLKNIYMFKDAELDLTYPAKQPSSTIEHEWLEHFPKIRYKRVCILSGANASGKTVLGKTLCMINNYLNGQDINQESQLLNLPHKMYKDKAPASFEVEFVTPDTGEIHLLKAAFDNEGLLEEVYRAQSLYKTLSYKTTTAKLRKSDSVSYYHRKKQNHEIENAGFSCFAHSRGRLKVRPNWHYQFSEVGSASGGGRNLKRFDKTIMKGFLCAFDSSIKDVKSLGEDEYRIVFRNNQTLLIDKGEIANKNRLSRGTVEAIEVATFYQDIKTSVEGTIATGYSDPVGRTFYLDEKLAYSHTEAEKAVLNLMIESLPRHSQLFYTTHNHDILEMNLPAHSFTFLKKDRFSEFIHPEKEGFNQNDRSLLGYIKNDVFGTLPNLDAINDLL